MRSRNIKPSFFMNEELSTVDACTRLMFIGLWCYADREGRFEWKPKRIEAAIFPYENVKTDKMLSSLLSLGMIARHGQTGYVVKFNEHQRPHPHEAASKLPPNPCKNGDVITMSLQCHDMSLHLHDIMKENQQSEIINDSNVMTLSLQCPTKIGQCQADIRNEDTINTTPSVDIPSMVIQDLNAKGGFHYTTNVIAKKLIQGRISDGHTVDDFYHVHSVMVEKWGNDEKMRQYLRPSTLYQPSKFEGYLNTNTKTNCMAGVR